MSGLSVGCGLGVSVMLGTKAEDVLWVSTLTLNLNNYESLGLHVKKLFKKNQKRTLSH